MTVYSVQHMQLRIALPYVSDWAFEGVPRISVPENAYISTPQIPEG